MINKKNIRFVYGYAEIFFVLLMFVVGSITSNNPDSSSGGGNAAACGGFLIVLSLVCAVMYILAFFDGIRLLTLHPSAITIVVYLLLLSIQIMSGSIMDNVSLNIVIPTLILLVPALIEPLTRN